MFNENNLPKCEKCKGPAKIYLNSFWVCGEHLKDVIDKLDQLKKDVLLKE